MKYKRLRELQVYLLKKEDKSEREKELLDELNKLLGKFDSYYESLAMSPELCPTCGKKL